MTTLDYARRYIALGWHVFPVWTARGGTCRCPDGATCENPGKHPTTKNGQDNATTDAATVERWFKRSDHNIAAACGLSQLVVIDVDVPRPKNGNTDGRKALAELIEEHGPLPATPTADTGSGGTHLVFAAPAGVQLIGKIGKAIDIKRNGYIVAPPSMHVSGAGYRWRAGLSPSEIAIAELTPEWIELVRVPEPEERPASKGEAVGEDFYRALESLDQRYVLQCVSGSPLVNGERFAFKASRKGNGKHNLFVDRGDGWEGTSNFIDASGRIAARNTGQDDGGPLASTWLRWYRHDDKAIHRGLIELVPELAAFVEAREARRRIRDEHPTLGDDHLNAPHANGVSPRDEDAEESAAIHDEQNGAAEHRTSHPTPTGPDDAPHAADAPPPKPRGPFGDGRYTDYGADADPEPAAPRWHRSPALVDLILKHASEPLVPLKLGDDELAVIRPGGTVAVMGPTGAGKSSLVAGMLVAHDGPTVVLSRELPADELAARAIGMQCDASWLDVLTGKVPRHEMERVLMPRLYVLDRKDATLGALHGAIQAAQQEYPDQQVLVAIDYVQILESLERETRAKVADILQQIDDIARAYRVVVLAISQMSRASSRAARNGEALGADSTDGGAESAAIERFATMTLSIGASGPDREDGTRAVDLSIGKGRMTGGDRVLPMSYCGRSGRWRLAGDARRAEEVRAEREGQRDSAKQRAAELAMVAAADKATEPQKREDLAAVAACSKDMRRAAMSALLARGDLVEVACKSPRSRAWKVWRPDKARAAGFRLADPEDE